MKTSNVIGRFQACNLKVERRTKESHPERKAAYFWTFSKRRGGGVKPESKSFGVVFFWLSFGHYGGKRGG